MKLLALGLLASVGAAASATIITFDEFTVGTVIDTQYAGVTFGSTGQNTTRAHAFSGATSQPNILCTYNANGALDCIQLVSVSFANPVNNLTFWAIEPNVAGDAVIGALYQNGVFTQNFTIAGLNGAGNRFVNLSAFANVTKIELRITSDEVNAGGVGYDDFSYNAVPEPASMLALAMGGLVLIRRKR